MAIIQSAYSNEVSGTPGASAGGGLMAYVGRPTLSDAEGIYVCDPDDAIATSIQVMSGTAGRGIGWDGEFIYYLVEVSSLAQVRRVKPDGTGDALIIETPYTLNSNNGGCDVLGTSILYKSGNGGSGTGGYREVQTDGTGDRQVITTSSLGSYWFHAGDGVHAILAFGSGSNRKYRISDGVEIDRAGPSTVDHARTVHRDNFDIYTTLSTGDGAVRVTPTTMASVTSLFTRSSPARTGIAVDPDFNGGDGCLYFADTDLFRCDLDGTSPVSLGTAPNSFLHAHILFDRD